MTYSSKSRSPREVLPRRHFHDLRSGTGIVTNSLTTVASRPSYFGSNHHLDGTESHYAGAFAGFLIHGIFNYLIELSLGVLPKFFGAVVCADENVALVVVALLLYHSTNGARLMELFELLSWDTGLFVASIGGCKYLVAANMKYLGW